MIGIVIFLIGLFLVLDYKHHGSVGLFSGENRALEILKERFARGEISQDEFSSMKNVLGHK